MKKTSRPVVFFGTEDFSLRSLESLYAAGYSIALVITKPDSERGRNRTLSAPAVKLFAIEHNIPCIQPLKISETASPIAELEDPIGVLVSFGKIIPKSILDLFPEGIINLHPSLLPQYRGPSPIESAIINGDNETGISIMKLEARMDAGPIFVQQKLALTGTENQPGLYDTLSRVGALVLVENLDSILDGTIRAVDQDQGSATYCSLLSKQDTLIDTADHTADWITRKVRAHLSYPKTALDIDTHRIIVTKAHTALEPIESALILSCKDNSLLSVDELIAPSGKRMNAEAFMRGYIVR